MTNALPSSFTLSSTLSVTDTDKFTQADAPSTLTPPATSQDPGTVSKAKYPFEILNSLILTICDEEDREAIERVPPIPVLRDARRMERRSQFDSAASRVFQAAIAGGIPREEAEAKIKAMAQALETLFAEPWWERVQLGQNVDKDTAANEMSGRLKQAHEARQAVYHLGLALRARPTVGPDSQSVPKRESEGGAIEAEELVPPPNWEGHFPMPIHDVRTFCEWLEFQIHCKETLLPQTELGRQVQKNLSDGVCLRNAYRVIDKLKLIDLPLEPVERLTVLQEVIVLRNLRRECLRLYGERPKESANADRLEDTAGGSEDVRPESDSMLAGTTPQAYAEGAATPELSTSIDVASQQITNAGPEQRGPGQHGDDELPAPSNQTIGTSAGEAEKQQPHDTTREAIRLANRQREEAYRCKREEDERIEQCRQAIRAFEEAKGNAISKANTASWAGQLMDPGPLLPEIGARLADALNICRTNGFLTRLDAFDQQQTVNHYYRPEEFGTREQATLGFDLARSSLQQAAAGSLPAEQAVKELWFDADLWPAGKWASLLLQMVVKSIVSFDGTIRSPTTSVEPALGATALCGQGRAIQSGRDSVHSDDDVNRPDALSPLQYDILDALRTLKATDPEKRVTGPEIASKVGGDTTEQSVKAPLADLKAKRLVDSKTGRHGGSWLTSKGLDCINILRPKR